MKRRARPAPASQKEKVKAFLDERMEQGKEGAYEALQLLRGQVQRSLKQGAAEQAVEAATEGSRQLLVSGFVASGAEMAMQLVEALEASPQLPVGTGLAALEAVDKAFDGCGSCAQVEASLSDRLRVCNAGVKWSRGRKDAGAYVLGHPRAHALAGPVCWRLSAALVHDHSAGAGRDHDGAHLPLAEQAIKHEVLAERPASLAKALGGGVSSGASSSTSKVNLLASHPRSASKQLLRRERAAAVLRAVLQFLAVENLRDANAFFQAVSASLPEGEATGSGVLSTLIPGLLLCCECDAPDVFADLKTRLGDGAAANGSANGAGSWGPPTTDPAALLRQVGDKFFGIKPPPDMMSTLLGMFGQGGGADDE